MSETPSIYDAIEKGNWSAVEVLARSNATDLREQNKLTPLLAIAGVKPGPGEADAYSKAVDAIVAGGVDLHARDERDATALDVAARYSPHAFVRITKALDDQEQDRSTTPKITEQTPAFTRRDIHSALLVADATLAKGTREEIPVLRLLDAERDAARRELAGKVTSAEAALHAELVAHRLIDQVRENPVAAATVGEQLRTYGVLNARQNFRTNEDRAPETIALVSAYKATQFTERGVANRLATQAFESLKTMASMGQTIDQSAKPEPDRLQAILSSARGHVSNMIEQQAQRGGRSNEMTR